MCTDPVAARNALVARTTGVGIALTLLAAALTGGVTGLLARPEPVAAEPPVAETAAPPVTQPIPRPRRTIYVRVPAAQPAPRPAARTSTRAPARSAPRPPAAPPRAARQPAVTTSSGS